MTISGGYNLTIDADYSSMTLTYLGTDPNGHYGWHTVTINSNTGNYDCSNVSFIMVHVWDSSAWNVSVTSNAVVRYDGTVMTATRGGTGATDMSQNTNKLLYLTADATLVTNDM